MIRCPACQHQEYEGTLYCSECGSQLWEGVAELAPSGVDEGAPTTQRLKAEEMKEGAYADLVGLEASALGEAFGIRSIVLRVQGEPNPVYLNGQEEYQLGRSDPRRGAFPDLDLSPYRALELGVSRQHALLRVSGQSLILIDLGSTNGTTVNGVRLAPNSPQPLRDGDELRLGKLALRVFLELG